MSWSYRPALDGLRTVAVYLVVIFHCGVAALPGGFVGVDLFFVLSGFLVSSILMDELHRTGQLQFGRFYARRVRRLLPAAVITIVVTSAVFLLISSTVRRLPLIGDAQSALLYVANWRFLAESSDYFAADIEKSPFLHFWSLAIEEQFYFIFPVILAGLALLDRRWRRATVVGVGFLFLASLGAQLYWAQIDPARAYYGTDARLYQLLAGVLAALLVRSGRLRLPRAAGGAATAAALVALIVVASSQVDLSPSWRGIAATGASVAVILGLMAADDSLVARALSRPVPTFLGRISYGTYLWHWPVVLVLAEVMTVRPVVLTAMVVVLATALAALSYEVLEMPIRRTQLLNRFQWRTLVVGVAASALVAVAAVPALLGADRRPVLTASNSLASGADGSRPVPSGLDWAELADDLGPPVTYCEPGDTEECVVVDGDGPHMLLVGDSQARMFAAPLIKLAKLHGYKLSLSVIPGCPWQQGLVNRLDPQDEQDRCRSVRENLYDSVISDSGVDLVVLVSLPRDKGSWEEDLISLEHEDEPLQQRILQATNETLDELDRIGVRTLIVEGMLETTGQLDPLDCLASAASMSECRVAVPITGPPSDAYYRTAAAMSENVFTVNINSVMCPAAPVCEPMLGGLPVWRDADHYLPKTLTLRKGEIWQAIEETGALEGLPQRP